MTSSYDEIYPVNVEIKAETGLEKDSVVLLNQIITVDIEERIIKKLGTLGKDKMKESIKRLR